MHLALDAKKSRNRKQIVFIQIRISLRRKKKLQSNHFWFVVGPPLLMYIDIMNDLFPEYYLEIGVEEQTKKKTVR